MPGRVGPGTGRGEHGEQGRLLDVGVLEELEGFLAGTTLLGATAEFRPASGGGTDFAITEQGVYLDGLDTVEQRRGGTEYLLDALGKTL